MKAESLRLMIVGVLCFAAVGQTKALAADRPVLAELFTSQSCSSCPPADDLLGELAKRPDIVALAFHVDYWDRLGWKDPYSSRAATERQRRYAELLGSQVYTPQLVIDGRAEAVGSDRRSVEALLQRPRAAMAPAQIRQDNGQLDIRIEAAPSSAPPAADILLVTFDPIHKTSIRGGENGGRLLMTYNDVRSLRAIGTWRGDPVAFQVAPSADEIGAYAAIIVQSPDGAIWALATTKSGAAE